ncbi:TonB-dependent receptor [Mangrovimicrobium sediminis]|nr:TonB-dependent receptor [Haliea sp. SAOS-164]
MKRFISFVGIALSLMSHQVLAATVYVAVFLDEAPLSGVYVTLDDVPLGVTNERGAAQTLVGDGEHKLELSDDDITLPVTFSSSADEDVEVRVVFHEAEGVEPVIDIRKFDEGATGASGYITGTVTDVAGLPIAGATVTAPGSGASATTDADGIYVLQVPRGDYPLEVSAEGYNDATMGRLHVMADMGVTVGVTLREPTPAGTSVALPSTQVEEVIVMGVFQATENSADIERFATTITNAIDVAQLERFGDSDVASALNRVVGVAVTDDKYATVRGLDGRYISSTLNGLLMPSTDPQRRDVQLDLFPTNILGGIEIQKSYTPDQLATTTGGSIKILTKGIPDERVLKVSGSLGYNFDFTGDDIVSHRGSNTDWAGFDSGLRKLPQSVVNATDGGRSLTICDPSVDPVRCTSELEAAQLGVKFQDDYNLKDKTALPDGGVSVAFGDRLQAGDSSNEWGYYLAADYDYSTSDRGDAELTNPLDTTGFYNRASETVNVNGYGVVGYEYGAANEILSKTTLLRSTDDTTRHEVGVDLEGSEVDKTIFQYVERQFFSQAFTGHNDWDLDHGMHAIDWRVAYSRTNRDEPDRRQYTYFNGNLSTSAFERRWSELEEDAIDVVLDYTFTLDWGQLSSTDFKAGVLWSDKEREVEQYRFGIRLGDRRDISLGIDQDLEKDILPYYNFALDRVRLAANTADTDSYDSTEEIKAYYLTTDTEFGEDWSMTLGARYEDFSQELSYPNQTGADNLLEADDWYPAFALTWRPTEEIQVRGGWSETVSYPGLIERSESLSYDPETDDPIFGNPDLDVSTIENLDLRVEYYFAETSSVSLAVFSKKIDKPIETALPDASGSAASGITFRNQDSADLLGVELDGQMDLLDEADYLLFVGGNISYIDSEVELGPDSLRLEGAAANGRQLQGQSEWLANIQIGFDHYPTDQKFTFLVNWFDDRIFRIARGAATGPEIEAGRVLIDLTYEKMFGENFTVEAAIKNLLNEKVDYEQNGRTIESYQTGTSIGVTLNYEFL